MKPKNDLTFFEDTIPNTSTCEHYDIFQVGYGASTPSNTTRIIFTKVPGAVVSPKGYLNYSQF